MKEEILNKLIEDKQNKLDKERSMVPGLRVTEEELEKGKENTHTLNIRNMRNTLYTFSQAIENSNDRTRETSLARTKMQEAMFWLEQELQKEIKL